MNLVEGTIWSDFDHFKMSHMSEPIYILSFISIPSVLLCCIYCKVKKVVGWNSKKFYVRSRYGSSRKN